MAHSKSLPFKTRTDAPDDIELIDRVALSGSAAEPINGNPSDQASVLEALTDLRDSAIFVNVFPSGLPEEAIISGWLNKLPEDYIEPDEWDVTAVLGTSYTAQLPEGEYLVWTDVYPDVDRGDMNNAACNLLSLQHLQTAALW